MAPPGDRARGPRSRRRDPRAARHATLIAAWPAVNGPRDSLHENPRKHRARRADSCILSRRTVTSVQVSSYSLQHGPGPGEVGWAAPARRAGARSRGARAAPAGPAPRASDRAVTRHAPDVGRRWTAGIPRPSRHGRCAGGRCPDRTGGPAGAPRGPAGSRPQCAARAAASAGGGAAGDPRGWARVEAFVRARAADDAGEAPDPIAIRLRPGRPSRARATGSAGRARPVAAGVGQEYPPRVEGRGVPGPARPPGARPRLAAGSRIS